MFVVSKIGVKIRKKQKINLIFKKYVLIVLIYQLCKKKLDLF